MISQNQVKGSQFAMIPRKGTFGAPEGAEHWDVFNTPAMTHPVVGAAGTFETIPWHAGWDTFDLLPATAPTAGNDAFLLMFGTGTVIVARATKGGINLKTKSSSPAQNDIAALKPVTSSTMIVPISVAAQPIFRTRVNPTQIVGLLIGAGLDQNVTDPDPTNTTGDGASFLFDPSSAAAHPQTGLNAANWILVQKVAGTYYYYDSGVPVVAGVDYTLVIQWDTSGTPSWYINGQFVGTAAQANTLTTTVNSLLGIKITSAGSPAQSDMDVRYVIAGRYVG